MIVGDTAIEAQPARHETIVLNASYSPSLINFRGPLIERMIAGGHKVYAIAPDFDEATRSAVEALGAHTCDAPMDRAGLNPLADLRYFVRLRQIFKHVGATLVVNYTIKPNIWGSLAAATLGIRSSSMITGLGFAFGTGRALRRKLVALVSRFLYRRALQANDIVIFQNPDDVEDLVHAHVLTDRYKARMVNGSGVDTEKFAPVPLPGEPVCLMIARLLFDKGVREYAEAAQLLKARHPGVKFLLVGYLEDSPNGISANDLARYQRAGLDFLGKIEDVRPAIADCSIFVLPSYREGTPRTVLEAMAMGRSIVTTDVPGCRQTVIDGENGFLVPARSKEHLADAIEKLIENADLRVTMGRASRALAAEKFDVHNVNREVMSHLSLADSGHSLNQ